MELQSSEEEPTSNISLRPRGPAVLLVRVVDAGGAETQAVEGSLSIEAGCTLSIGRKRDACDVRIGCKSISKRHVEISNSGDGGRCTVTDLGASNGTFVSNVRIKKYGCASLLPGTDRLRLASAFVFDVQLIATSPPSRAQQLLVPAPSPSPLAKKKRRKRAPALATADARLVDMGFSASQIGAARCAHPGDEAAVLDALLAGGDESKSEAPEASNVVDLVSSDSGIDVSSDTGVLSRRRVRSFRAATTTAAAGGVISLVSSGEMGGGVIDLALEDDSSSCDDLDAAAFDFGSRVRNMKRKQPGRTVASPLAWTSKAKAKTVGSKQQKVKKAKRGCRSRAYSEGNEEEEAEAGTSESESETGGGRSFEDEEDAEAREVQEARQKLAALISTCRSLKQKVEEAGAARGAGGTERRAFEEIVHSALATPEAHLRLKSYQLDGVSWLHACHTAGVSPILADEMGLGKTVQTISLLALLRGRSRPGARPRVQLPHLIVAPTSVVMAWQKECTRWSPGLHPAVYRGTMKERAQLRYTLKAFGVLIVGYAPLRRMLDRRLPRLASHVAPGFSRSPPLIEHTIAR
jgi:hypothetical protein